MAHQGVKDSVIAVDHLTKQYHSVTAVNNVTFAVPRGVVCGFVGPNGSGKTTTIRILLGLIRPSGGTGHVLGASIREPSAYLHRVGALIESPVFYPSLSGRDNLRLLAQLGGIDLQRVEAVLRQVGLAARGRDKVRQYSLGMKQRLGLAAALLPEPELLILDEPTNGLDPAGIVETRTLLRQCADSGITVFVSSHLLTEIEQVCDHLVMLLEGQVAFAGPMAALSARVRPRLVLCPEYAADLQRLAALAEQTGVRATIVDQTVIVEGTAGAAAINRAAAGAGITLVGITSQQPGLEDVFFQLTQGTHHDESPALAAEVSMSDE